jgi:hypothetical protein
VLQLARLPLLGIMLIITVPPQTGPSAPPSNSSCPPFISNYTSGVASLNIFTSFLQTYESVGLDTDPSSGFSLFAPTDRAWNRIEQTLSAHTIRCILSCEHDLMRRTSVHVCLGLQQMAAAAAFRPVELNEWSWLRHAEVGPARMLQQPASAGRRIT